MCVKPIFLGLIIGKLMLLDSKGSILKLSFHVIVPSVLKPTTIAVT